MIDKLLTIVILVIGIIGVSYIIDDYTGNEPDEEDIQPGSNGDNEQQRILIIDGYKALVLDDEVLQSIGLQTEQLAESTLKPEFYAFAEVLDITPLVSLKTEYSNLLAERQILQNALNNQSERFKRAGELHDIKGLSTSEYEQIRSELEHKSAEFEAIKKRIQNLEYTIKTEWGNVLAALILEPEKESEFNSFAMQEKFLVRISLPKDKKLSGVSHPVYINLLNIRESAVRADYIDRSRQAGNPLYGESYIYQVESAGYRPGMRLFAWLEETDVSLSGLFVQDNAVIWYANQPWVYVQYDDHTFIRKPLDHARKVNDGWLVSSGIEGNEKVVISGGQTLLSEEFKWAIPDEDDD